MIFGRDGDIILQFWREEPKLSPYRFATKLNVLRHRIMPVECVISIMSHICSGMYIYFGLLSTLVGLDDLSW